MHNVTYKVEKNKLIIEVDIGPKMVEDAVPSSTGKTKLVASTSGATPIPVNGASLKFALNVTSHKK